MGENDIRPTPTQYYTILDPIYCNADFNDAAYNASAYLDYSFLLFKKLTINAGGRYDYTGFTDQNTFSPRVSGNLQLNETNSINFTSGIYYQDPVYSEIADQPKNRKLKVQKVTNFIIGYKRQFSPVLIFFMEGWYKSFDNMVVLPVRAFRQTSNNTLDKKVLLGYLLLFIYIHYSRDYRLYPQIDYGKNTIRASSH